MEDRFDDIDVEDIKEQIKAYAELVRPKDVKNRALIMNSEGDKAVKEIILKYSNILLKPEDIDKVIKRAYVRTTTDTHQLMEAVVHNLNSMHCLPASEKIWVYDTFEDEFKLIRMDELNKNFEINRYKVLLINKDSGKTEFKYITSSKRVGNGRTISTVVDKAGHTVRVTDNHRIMDIDNNGDIIENYPKDVKYLLLPRNIMFPAINNDICLQEYGRVRRDSPYFEDHIAITELFAELMGYYMADGCILGKNGAIMCITACEKVSHEYLCALVADVFGDRVTLSKTMYNNSKHGELIKDSRFYIGSRLAKMIIDKFGRIGSEKKIPKEIMFSSPEIRSAFLKAYFICDGRSKTKYAESSLVNKDLRDSIQLMIMSLGGYCLTNDRTIESPFNGKINNIHSVCMSNREAKRVGVSVDGNTSFEIPKYSLSIAGKVLGIDTGLRRKDNEVRYCELEDALGNGNSRADKYLNFFLTPVKSVLNEITDEDVYDISVEDNENFLTSSCIFVHNSRAGAQVPFSSLNFGTDTSYEGRLVIEQLLLSTDEGLGNGETPIFPVSVFKMKKGVSAKPGDPNYDLFELACKVSAKRLFPNFGNVSASYNIPKWKGANIDSPDDEYATMGCVEGNETIRYKIDDVEYFEGFKKAFERVAKGRKILTSGKSEYIDTSDENIRILDSYTGDFVQVKKFIRNHDVDNWRTVKFSDGYSLVATSDHPLPVVGKGRTFVGDMKVGDKVLSSKFVELTVLSIEDTEFDDYSYDVETVTDRFDVSGIQSHNCRTRVFTNVRNNGINGSVGRGNLSFTSINLPRLGLLAGRGNIDKFFELLDERMELVHRQLKERFEIQCLRHPRNYPFLMGQGIWKGSEDLGPDDDIRDALLNGTLTVGFIGLAETLVALTGKHHGESEESQELGLKIIGHMRELTDKWTQEEKMNYSVIGTPRWGTCDLIAA